MAEKAKYDAGDPKDVKSAKQQAKLLEERFSNGMRKICDDVETRAVLEKFFEEVGIFRDEPSIPTPNYMFEHGRNTGKRSAGLWWLEKALLHDSDIIGKLEADKQSPIRVRTQTERK